MSPRRLSSNAMCQGSPATRRTVKVADFLVRIPVCRTETDLFINCLLTRTLPCCLSIILRGTETHAEQRQLAVEDRQAAL